MLPPVADAFAPTYAEARARFCAAATARGLAVESSVLPGRTGAAGEVLASDLALLGRPDAANLLLLTSGTHGVEGFCGSGCQVALLRDDDFAAAVAAAGVAVLFYHAVNPYGFSHLRRVNEDNVDLNRNFRDFSRVPPPNRAYAEVHGFMLPPTWPPGEAADAALAAYVTRHGQRALQAALSSGQCEFPDGLFYGGTRPTWSNETVRSALRHYAARCERLVWIDVHTALGPCGHGEKIYAGPDDTATLARTRAIFGADVTSFYDGSSTSAPLTGVMFNAALGECPQAAYAGIALEYGTVPLDQVVEALRAEQWLALHPEAAPRLGPSIKRAMRAAFEVATPEWRGMVVGQARVACLQAVRSLAVGTGDGRVPR